MLYQLSHPRADTAMTLVPFQCKRTEREGKYITADAQYFAYMTTSKGGLAQTM